ncbi:MAG: hypothetical protein GY727_09200 [Gammaproteobacteria bacterium]|nr:hypothetical protein [Gammaproteobacteria bacterium]MCP4089531.1 hypothetical protein [Gammaproteobacteria bacterium]
MSIFISKIVAFLLLSSCALPVLSQEWDFEQKSAGLALSYESKMPDEDRYEGMRVLLQGQYYLDKEREPVDEGRSCCKKPSVPTVYRGLMEGKIRYSFDGSGLETLNLGLSPWSILWVSGEENTSSSSSKKDYLAVGATRFIKDKPLEVDYYLEVALGRAGRQVEFHAKPDSPHTYRVGVQSSLGWALAETEVAGYSDVSNPFVGFYVDLEYEHEKWGGVYVNARFINGFSFSNPTRGHPTVREGQVRNGYFKQFQNCLKLDVYWAKRSFYFDEGGLPGLYSWGRSYATELSCRFN